MAIATNGPLVLDDQDLVRRGITEAADGRRHRTVPTIVPVTRQNSVFRANASQLARSEKSKIVKDLRVKTKMAEMLIGV